MIIRPPKEILKYISFRNGEVVMKAELPKAYRELFEEYKEKYMTAKKKQSDRVENIRINESC